MTILGLELASFNSYRLHSTLPLFIMESRGDRLPSPASKVVLFSVSSSTEKIKYQLISVRPVFVISLLRTFISLRLLEDYSHVTACILVASMNSCMPWGKCIQVPRMALT